MDQPVRAALAQGRGEIRSRLKKTATSPVAATFVFQTLGYVETQDGEMRAVVADGSEVYLVKQGETFADKYRATSVDPTLVLAVKVVLRAGRRELPFCPDRIRRPSCIQETVWIFAFSVVRVGKPASSSHEGVRRAVLIRRTWA